MDPWSMNGQTGSPQQMGYPTMQNAYGIGAQTGSYGDGGFGQAPQPQTQAGQSSQQPSGGPAGPGTQGVAGGPDYLSKPLGGQGDTNSIGANPWSLTGEANSR